MHSFKTNPTSPIMGINTYNCLKLKVKTLNLMAKSVLVLTDLEGAMMSF